MSTSKTILLSNVVKNFIMIWLNLRTSTTIADFVQHAHITTMLLQAKLMKIKKALKLIFISWATLTLSTPTVKLKSIKTPNLRTLKRFVIIWQTHRKLSCWKSFKLMRRCLTKKLRKKRTKKNLPAHKAYSDAATLLYKVKAYCDMTNFVVYFFCYRLRVVE